VASILGLFIAHHEIYLTILALSIPIIAPYNWFMDPLSQYSADSILGLVLSLVHLISIVIALALCPSVWSLQSVMSRVYPIDRCKIASSDENFEQASRFILLECKRRYIQRRLRRDIALALDDKANPDITNIIFQYAYPK